MNFPQGNPLRSVPKTNITDLREHVRLVFPSIWQSKMLEPWTPKVGVGKLNESKSCDKRQIKKLKPQKFPAKPYKSKNMKAASHVQAKNLQANILIIKTAVKQCLYINVNFVMCHMCPYHWNFAMACLTLIHHIFHGCCLLQRTLLSMFNQI